MEKLKKLTAYDLTTKEKGFLSVLIGFAVSFNVLFFGMLYIFITNRIGFPVLFSEVLSAALATSLPVWLVVAGVLFVIPKKLYSIFASLAVGGVVAAYVQGNILNRFANLGALTGDAINWDEYRTFSLVTAAVWLLLIIAPLAVRYFAPTLMWKRTLLAVCLLLSAMQGAALISAHSQNREDVQYEPKYYLSREGAYEVSSIDNILVFVIDRLDYRYIEDVRESDPTFFDRLDGFTDFNNAASSYSNTFPAGVTFTTGIPYDYAQTRREYFDYAWNNSEFIDTLKAAGYTMKYHMSHHGYFFTNYNQIVNIADNIRDGRPAPLRSSVAWNFRTLSLYRFSPMLLKPHFWMPLVTFEMQGDITERERVVPESDSLFMELLKESGLTLKNDAPNYFYVYLYGSHEPFVMDENGLYVGESDIISQTRGCFNIVFNYMDEMKRLGVYENSTILILGDHGWHEDSGFHIGFFVKPKGSAGTPLEQNNAPISTNEHFIATILQSGGFDYSSFGYSAFDVEQDTPGERFAINNYTDIHNHIELLRIVGHVGNPDNIELVGIREFHLRGDGMPVEPGWP